MHKAKQSMAGKWVLTIIMLAVGIAFIYPFLFMVSSGFKPAADIFTKPFELIPSSFTMQNYTKIFTHTTYNIGRWYVNTIVMTLLIIALKMLIVTMAAYAFSKIRFPGRNAIFLLLLASMMIPADIMIMPRYIIFSRIGVIDSMWSLILPAVADAYFVFLIRQSFLGISESISEAAKIDGCGHFRIYRQIIMPLAGPAVTTMVLFSFVWAWNDYMAPYLYISDVDKQMLSVGIRLLSAGQVQDYGAQMAAATVVLLPILVIFIFCQRYFVEGISSGAVKG